MTDSICLDCGMCCDGTLFGRGRIQPGEAVEPLVAHGLVVSVEGDEGHFAQPCPAFCGTCSIYDERPVVCRGFRCALLVKVEDGAVQPDQARATIARAIELRDRCVAGARQVLGPNAPSSYRLLLDAVRPSTDPQQAAQLYVDMAALNLMISRHFLLPDDAPTASADR